MYKFNRLRWILAAVSISATAPTLAEDGHFSTANRLLFLSDHLESLAAPAQLSYSLEVKQPAEAAFEDRIELRITPSRDGNGKDVEVDYLSGERKRYVPQLSGAHGNPVIMVFLQRDVNEMARDSASPARAFQRMIKRALEDSAEVVAVTFEFGGRDAHATKITIDPFARSEMPGRHAEFAGKRYEFTISEAVPGWVYAVRTLAPPDGGEAGRRTPIAQLEFTGSTP